MLQRHTRHVCCVANSAVSPIASALLDTRTPAPWPSQQPCIRAYRCSLLRCPPVTSSSSCRYLRCQAAASPVACRPRGATAAAATATASTSNALLHAVQLEPQVAFLTQLLWQGVLLPVLASWLFVTALSAVASRAHQVRADGSVAARSQVHRAHCSLTWIVVGVRVTGISIRAPQDEVMRLRSDLTWAGNFQQLQQVTWCMLNRIGWLTETAFASCALSCSGVMRTQMSPCPWSC